eukprot:gene48857-66324_t
MLTTMSAWLDFLIASGSAKWAAMSPVATPMMMLLGISPEMTTAAYRVGDTVTNLISPLNAYFVLTFTYCRRWIPDFRLGTLLALMLPLAVAFYLGGVAVTAAWVALELPVGPGASQTQLLVDLGFQVDDLGFAWEQAVKGFFVGGLQSGNFALQALRFGNVQ